MRKILLFLFILFFSINGVYTMMPSGYLNKVPKNFKSQCYEYYGKIDKSEVWDNNNKYQTYKIQVNKNNLVFTQMGFILPYKYFSDKKNIYNYENSLNLNNSYLLDYNINTYKEINSKTQSEIVLSFQEIVEKDNFNFHFNYFSDNYLPVYYISNDKENWDKIAKENVENFSFKYLKIKFESKTKDIFLENIKIYELNFPKKSNTYLVKSFYNEDIELYSKYNCKEDNYNIRALNYDNFSIDKNTKLINVTLENNPKYNVYEKFDSDNDWVEDSIDNCKTRYNPLQKDSNGDGIGDVCSDDDKDGIIGYYDNCINIYNPDQKDVNINGIGDVCEFDKDKDGVYDSIDNCVNIQNPNQEDTDKDGIGDICDNCEYYNPTQIDKDGNNLGDVCDKKIKDLKENDDDKDGIINYKDNCKEIPNPNQLDTDKDGVGDACDNCRDIKNNNQLDENKNNIGDMCEDSDNNGILGYLDNCINISNPAQKDDDNNGIGNLCEDKDNDKIPSVNDNCPYDYNPEQDDVDNDNIGDKCDEKDDRFIESNKLFFIGLLVFIALVFGGGIFYMFRKLK